MLIKLEGQTHHVKGEEHRSVLDCALIAEVFVPYSCREGICNTCVAEVTYNGGLRRFENTCLLFWSSEIVEVNFDVKDL